SLNLDKNARFRTFSTHRVLSARYEGNRGVIIDSRSRSSNSITELTLTLDLSDYSGKKIELDFEYWATYFGTDDKEDIIKVRGNENESWITILKWQEEVSSRVNKMKFRLDQILNANNQDFGATFQIQFSVAAQGELLSPTREDGFILDNVSIKEVFANNGALSNSGIVCSGNNDMDITLHNLGFDTIKSANIKAWINNSTPKNYAVTGINIAPNDSATVLLKDILLSVGKYEFAFLVDSLNGKLDSTRNDTLYSKKTTGIQGKYTVSASSGDFKTLQSAFDILMKNGVCGDVDLHLSDEVYNGPFVLSNVSGLDKYHLTITGQDSSQSILSGSSVFIFYIENAGNIHFENCGFNSESINQINAFYVNGNEQSISINNCSFTLTDTVNNRSHAIEIRNCDKVLIENTYFSPGYSEYFGIGNSLDESLNTIKISNCKFPASNETNSIRTQGRIIFTNNVLNSGASLRAMGG
ncbi:MAG: hypothetical protein ACPGLV_18685, partial [Bacteroidia bacterium]